MNQGVFASQQPVAGYRLRRKLFTTSGVWSTPPGVRSIRVLVVGGAGGGSGASTPPGGCPPSGAQEDETTGGNGGIGSVVIDNPPSSVPVTVGAGGAAGSAGTSSSFGSLAQSTGGTGATASANGSSGAFTFAPSCLQDDDMSIPVSNDIQRITLNGAYASSGSRTIARPSLIPYGSSRSAASGIGGCVMVEWVEVFS